MIPSLELVYQYRLLCGKREVGQGQTMTEIEMVGAIERLFGRHHHASSDSDRRACRREFTRVQVGVAARLRNSKLYDDVLMVNIGPGGMACSRAPYVEVGDSLEVVVDDTELNVSYRFRARVSWLRAMDDDDDFDIGLQLLGTALLIRYGPPFCRARARRLHAVAG